MSDEVRHDGGEFFAEQRTGGPKTPEGKAKAIANLIPLKPGETANPAGRPAAGATLKEWLNVFAAQDLTEKDLRTIARDASAPWPKRAAANRAVKTMESPDLSDFAGLMRGENQLEDLRAMGINTDVVKKFKQKTRRVPVGDGVTEEVIERDIELHDRSGDDFDRITNHTDGTPIQTVKADVHSDAPTDKAELAMEVVALMVKANANAGKLD